MPAKTTWQVTDQARDQVINTNAGQTITGTIVYFITGEGNEGSVFVPNNRYHPDTIKKMVHAEAIRTDEVGRLVSD